MQSFLGYAVTAEIWLSQEFQKKKITILLLRYIQVTASLLFLIIYILHVNFCAILSNRNRDITIQRI